jgi:hypothetical protein
MDMKAIEAALVRANEADCFASALPSESNEANDELVALYGPDLLRLVRAMAWMTETGSWVSPCGTSVPPKDWRPRTRMGYDFDHISVCDDFTTPLDAIEAAMADQQAKGATDESP